MNEEARCSEVTPTWKVCYNMSSGRDSGVCTGRLRIACVRREEAPPDMDESDYRRVERERRRSSLAKGKDRRSSKAGMLRTKRHRDV